VYRLTKVARVEIYQMPLVSDIVNRSHMWHLKTCENARLLRDTNTINICN